MRAHNRFGGHFDFDAQKRRLLEVKRELENPDIWQSPEKAQALGKERAALDYTIGGLEKIFSQLKDADELLQIVKQENDESLADEIKNEISSVLAAVAALEFQRMFAGEMDAHNAYIEIQSGSGGTEAQDWAEMLLRMYTRWCIAWCVNRRLIRAIVVTHLLLLSLFLPKWMMILRLILIWRMCASIRFARAVRAGSMSTKPILRFA